MCPMVLMSRLSICACSSPKSDHDARELKQPYGEEFIRGTIALGQQHSQSIASPGLHSLRDNPVAQDEGKEGEAPKVALEIGT